MNAEAPTYKIKQATPDDIPFMRALGAELYPGRDTNAHEPWVRWAMTDPNHLILVGPNSMGCAQIAQYYGLHRHGRCDFLASRPAAGHVMEPLKMVRIMLWWAQSRGAQSFRLVADPDTGINFAPFARRLGGTVKTMVQCNIPLGRQ